ncbi:DEAD/DEAH box helicase [Halocatena pleomorpha]|uniref:DEAD/DEAH box helicase n=1 Tax=Halocatena pleomorpha TaxID=1785090 RepID=A0A3P3R4D1_9EURY|nr:DEAD/DEAH box helicase [Halocatena pleomorpha]RRJ28346.1 DEAD/DEAH box helicase [Halocatena pleomorpha]
MNVAERIPEFAGAFPFDSFNRMQTEALPAILEREENVVVSAPTASGKTALAELAICKTLKAAGTALFLAPLRALTNEKEREWERFEELGYSVYVVTGERDFNSRKAERADILVMTPEKADSATRKHDSSRYQFIRNVDCCVIDEVHLLDSDRRGSVLEVTVARLRRLCDPRIVALSATMPNVDDVAGWLDAVPETTFQFGEDYRPIPLSAEVRTYTHGDNPFADKYRRLYRALDLAEPHIRDGGQALMFVASRQDTRQAAEKARDELASRDVPIGARGEYDFHTETQTLTNDTLRKSVLDGVAFHHAGLSREDKTHVEQWFRRGDIQLLFSTSTLAWGVNLPARCVVIRDTKLHDPLEGEVDMSPLDVLQMLGRAGRPGYDDAGYAYVVCDRADAESYRTLLQDGTPIESRLADDLATHLNAEIALGTIGDLNDVMEWLETTFYFVRARRASTYDSGEQLRDTARETLSSLVTDGFVKTDERHIEPTPLGQLTSRYYLRLDTAARFDTLCKRDAVTEADVLETVAGATEFDSVSARQSEREAISAVVSGRTSLSEPSHRKVLAILKSSTTGSTPSELQSDAWVIRHNALRLLGALRTFLDRFADPPAANVARRVEARVENAISTEAVGLTAIDGVGSGRAKTLARAGLSTPADVIETGVDGLIDAGLSKGVAKRVLDSARELPAVAIKWGAFPDAIPAGENDVREVTVTTTAGTARATVAVTVNGVSMMDTSTYLGETTVPVGVFGGDADELEYTITVAFPELPLVPITESKTVRVV